MSANIRRAVRADVPRIMAIRHAVRENQRGRGQRKAPKSAESARPAFEFRYADFGAVS
jgi:hypothetical protein